MIVRLRIGRDLTRGLVLNISPLQLWNRRIDATINERDDDSIPLFPCACKDARL